jgi:ubiquinone/menaquinone biosynthesis C-methylase UbiE
MIFKDLFSRQATDYARFRPSYPAKLFAWLELMVSRRQLAVDVGAGNGQASVALKAHFDRVIAIDPSAGQLANAAVVAGVEYQVGSAEATGLDAGAADLMISAQAFHWFNQPAFFEEVRRVVRQDGCLAVWCYGLSKITPAIDAAVYELYEGFLGPYWEPERRLVEDGYRSVAFPFEEIDMPEFEMQLEWSFEQLVGYLGTWSPLKKYREERGDDPLAIVLPRLTDAWGGATERVVSWPLSVRAFRL